MGTFSETMGHASRVARFLHKSSLARQDGGPNAFVVKNETTGDISLSRRRFAQNSPKPNFGLESAVADFSHVTIKNPANITLVQDLTMQATSCPFFPFTTRLLITQRASAYASSALTYVSFSSCSCPGGKAASYLGRQAAASRRYCASLVVYGPQPVALSGYRNTSDPTACFSFHNVRLTQPMRTSLLTVR